MIKPILDLFFPRLCYACEKASIYPKQFLCVGCLSRLPRTHLYRDRSTIVPSRFWGRIPIERATAYLYFESFGLSQKLIHQFKYQGKKDLAIGLGSLAARELLALDFFNGIDLLIPMPLHRKKERVRGYNQSLYLAKGISKVSGIPIEKNMVNKEEHTHSQTKKSRFNRWLNVKNSFALNQNEKYKGKHVLLIDDVLTTGATAEACGKELLQIEGLRLSFLCLAIPF